MKKLIILLIVIHSSTVFCQDYEPAQVKFNWGVGGSLKYLSGDSMYFKQDKMIIGWHWGASRRISEAVYANQNDAIRNIDDSELADSCNVFMKPIECSHAVGPEVMNARAIQYEPTLSINPNKPDSLIIRQGDTTRPVFGFQQRRGRILTDSTDENFNRLIIDGDSLINEVILSEPWPCNQLNMFGKNYFQNDSVGQYIINTYLCRNLYFSINLRRFDDEMSDDTILKIELPYTYLFDSTYTIPPDTIIHHKTVVRYENIQFAALPSNAQYPQGCYELANGRGWIRDTISTYPGYRAIYITKKMLPPDSQNKDITISAFFILNYEKRHNPELKIINPEVNKIDSIKIKITYLGGSPIAIDWVRFETPHAQKFLRGYYDSSIVSHVQEDLNKFIADSFLTRGIKLFRYNILIEGGLQHWLAEKYFSKLVGNITTGETGPLYPKHYEYYTKASSRYIGLKINEYEQLTPAPPK